MTTLFEMPIPSETLSGDEIQDITGAARKTVDAKNQLTESKQEKSKNSRVSATRFRNLG